MDDGAIGGGGAAERRSVGDRVHERRHRVGQLRHSRRRGGARSRPGGAISSPARIEHEAVLNTLQGARAARMADDAAACRSHGHRRRPIALREVDHRRHRARLGDAREQRDRHDSADRRAGRHRARARRAHAHRRRCSRPARFRSTCARSASISCRCRRTSSTDRRASARCGSSAARGMQPILTGGKHEAQPAGGHRERAGDCRARASPRGWRPSKIARRRRARRRTCAIGSRTASCSGVPGHGRQRRARRARAQHDQHQLRSRRGREPADRARSRGRRGVDRFGLLVGHARAVARAARDGAAHASHAELAAVQPRDAVRPEVEVDPRRSEVLAAAAWRSSTRTARRRHLVSWLRLIAMRIVVAMSGGVDSSVAAALLAEQGHDVIGLSMQLYDQAEGADLVRQLLLDRRPPRRPARRAAAINIPHYILNFERQFNEQVVSNFVERCTAGRTPLPCAHCNSDLKFATLVERARGFGADAGRDRALRARRARRRHGRLSRSGAGVDPARTSRTSCSRSRRISSRTRVFPSAIAEGGASATTRGARRSPVADKPDSQEICFIPDDDYAAFVTSTRPMRRATASSSTSRGACSAVTPVSTGSPSVSARAWASRSASHGASAPLYVLALRPADQQVVVGPRAALEQTRLTASGVNWIVEPPADGPVRVAAQIRHRHQPAPPPSASLGDGRAEGGVRHAADRDHAGTGRGLLRWGCGCWAAAGLIEGWQDL